MGHCATGIKGSPQPGKIMGALLVLALSCVGLAAVLSPTLAYGQVPTTTGWHEIPNTKLRAVCPPNNFGGTSYPFASACTNVTAAWSGGVYDSQRDRLIIWGGGHTDYYGNEVYALDLRNLTMSRLTNPGVPLADGSCQVTAIAGGTQPNSRHTYNGLAYIAHTDQMFATAGSVASNCGAAPQPADVWLFNLATNTWTRPSITYVGVRPGTGTDMQGYTAVYHPGHRMVYFHDQAYLFRFDPANNTVTQIGKLNGITYTTNAVLDPVRNLYVIMGNTGSQVEVYDLSNAATAGTGQLTGQTINTSGSPLTANGYPGLAYDPTRNSVVGWRGGDSIYMLNTTTWAWTSSTFSGGPTAIPTGTNGRWRYSPQSNMFVVVNSIDSNAYALRLAPGTPGSPGGSASVAPAAPTGLQVR